MADAHPMTDELTRAIEWLEESLSRSHPAFINIDIAGLRLILTAAKAYNTEGMINLRKACANYAAAPAMFAVGEWPPTSALKAAALTLAKEPEHVE